MLLELFAVVVAGISLASRFKKITVFDAKLDSVSHTIWGTITFMLNGMVFFLLGTELPTLAAQYCVAVLTIISGCFLLSSF